MRHRTRGFTLVELLVYTAIFAIVAGMLTTIFLLIVNSQKKTAVSSEVSQQLNFVLTTVQRLVGDSALVEAVYEGQNPSSTCATFCTLKLRRIDPTKDPTLISSDATGIYLQEGTSPQVTLTTNKVLINHLRLTKHEIPGGHAVVEISTSFNYNTTNPTFAVTKAIESAIARVNAATFDADLLPNQDNTFDIGQVSGSNLRWRSGRFSGDLTVGGNLGIGTTTVVNKLGVAGNAAIGSSYAGLTAPTNGLIIEGNVGIGTTTPASSAILSLSSTSLGFLPPRLTTAQRDAVSSPATGLLIYNTTTNALNVYDGAVWSAVGGSGGATVATSISGCGIASSGKICLLRVGSSPYEFVTLIYDETFGKWISDTFPILNTTGLGDATGDYDVRSMGNEAVAMRGSTIAYKNYYNAGLRLQLRQYGIYFGTNSQNLTTQVFIQIDSTPNFNSSGSRSSLQTNFIMNSIGGQTSNTWHGRDSGWGQVTVDGTSRDTLSIIWIWESAGTQTMYAGAKIDARWVSQ